MFDDVSLSLVNSKLGMLESTRYRLHGHKKKDFDSYT